MLLLILLLLLSMLIIGLYFLFRLIKWILKKKVRSIWALVLLTLVALSWLIKFAFFTKMEFISSKVYPDLYLVKNPVNNKDSIHSAIKRMVQEKVNNKFITEIISKDSFEKRGVPYRLRFYEYYTGTPIFVPFGEAGTTHFIEHEEDPGGFSSEEISNYNTYRIAEFYLKYCDADSLNFVGTIDYYQNWEIIKTDTILNQCKINTAKVPADTIVEE